MRNNFSLIYPQATLPTPPEEHGTGEDDRAEQAATAGRPKCFIGAEKSEPITDAPAETLPDWVSKQFTPSLIKQLISAFY